MRYFEYCGRGAFKKSVNPWGQHLRESFSDVVEVQAEVLEGLAVNGVNISRC